MDSVRDILVNLGYHLIDSGKDYRAKPLYRDSSSNTVLSINKGTGRWIDFKEQRFGTLEELVRLTLKLEDISQAKLYISNNFEFEVPKPDKEKLKSATVFSAANLEKIVPDYSYWAERGISRSTLKIFESGVMHEGKMKNRYVFPVFDFRNRLMGAAGRDLTNTHGAKWKFSGEKSLWAYPLKYNRDILRKQKEVFLVESIGDMLSLWESGIRNTIVTFGLHVSPKIKQILIALDPNKIYISFNNDDNKAGNNGARKAYQNLRRQFDPHQLEIALPPKNDFGCMSPSEIIKWNKKLRE